MSSVLDGVDEKTTRATLYSRLRTAAKSIDDLTAKLSGAERRKADAKVGRLQEIEERVRAKAKPRTENETEVLLSGTDQEFEEAKDFLANWEDGGERLLPTLLVHVYRAAQHVTGEAPDVSDAEEVSV